MYKKLLTALMSIMICTFFSTAIVSAGEATYDGDGGGEFRIADGGIGPGIGFDADGTEVDPLYLSARNSSAIYSRWHRRRFYWQPLLASNGLLLQAAHKAKSELALEFLMRGKSKSRG